MASSIIHLAVTGELIKQRQFTDVNRLRFGAVLPDAGHGSSHMKIYVAGGHRKTYDLEGFRSIYGGLMKKDDLYLGYYLHLIQDLVYRHFVYDKHHWDPHTPGNVEKLHRDYTIGNTYVINKYGLSNDLAVPTDFDAEPINRICVFDTDGLMQRMAEYFIHVPDDDIFFFTKEMADEYIAEAVDCCIRELDALDSEGGTDSYTAAWENAHRSLLESTLNTRDLGMYRIAGTKRYTAANVIYRSDRCDTLSAHDKELLLSRGITTVIDLRSTQEAEQQPSAFAAYDDFNSFHFPITEGMEPPASLDEVPLSYMSIAAADCMKDVFGCIADAPGGVLFHCTAGKDRTGVVSAVLLSLAGVSDEDIIYDYALSREFNKVRLEAFLQKHPETDREIVLANERSMEKFLELFRKKYGTAERYLSHTGLTAERIRSLGAKLG